MVSNNNYKQSSDSLIRLNQKTYKILQAARFVTVPPTWRDYLTMDYKIPERPDPSLFPKNNAEITVWNNNLMKGWQQGITQANEIFRENVNRMTRDFNGIVLYKELLERHMISKPYVSKSSFGVTGNSQEVNINDQVMRITKTSGLTTDANKWKVILNK